MLRLGDKVYVVVRRLERGTVIVSDEAFIYENVAWEHARALVTDNCDESAHGFGWVIPETFPDNFPMIPPLSTVRSVVEAFNWFMERDGDDRRVSVQTLLVR